MSTPRRVQLQPAFILHHRPFRDTSQLLDVLSLEHGKLALVARGSRASKSRLRGILRPFQPLRLSWFLRADLGTLTGAEIGDAPLALVGDNLLAGYYANELLIHFLHRHDPHSEVFDLYRDTIASLVTAPDPAPVMRRFEMELLRLLGYALNLGHEAGSAKSLVPDANYEYRVEQGAVLVQRDQGAMIFKGQILGQIGARQFDDKDTLRDAGRLLQAVINYHLDGRELKSRKVLRDLYRSRKD